MFDDIITGKKKLEWIKIIDTNNGSVRKRIIDEWLAKHKKATNKKPDDKVTIGIDDGTLIIDEECTCENTHKSAYLCPVCVDRAVSNASKHIKKILRPHSIL